MREFFHGWRRKMGCVTLVMALAAWSGWLRSHFADDNILAYTSTYTCETLQSAAGNIIWFSEIDAIDIYAGRSFLEWESYPINPNDERLQPHPDGTWKYPFGFKWNHFGGPGGSTTSRIISDWYLIIPLTLLSTWLLLWKPRQTLKTVDPGMNFSQSHNDTEKDKNIFTNKNDLPSVPSVSP